MISRWCAALALLSLIPLAARAQPGSAEGEPAAAAELAVVVLIGEANRSAELTGVLSELLLQEGVQPQFVAEPRFERSALLDANAQDGRVWVFVALERERRARLYFRGPFGERFLLRELALRAGLDEVGRELIARVVQTSTVALLRSREGISRAQAEVEVARVAAQNPDAVASPAAEPAPAAAHPSDVAPSAAPADREDQAGARSERQERSWLLGVRVLGAWTGDDLGARLGAGIEAGALLLRASSPRLRLRLAFEPSLPQSIDSGGIEAEVMSWPLRLGLDLGWARGPHAFWLGAATGIDIVRVSSDRASDPSLSLSKPVTYARPVSRAELRYELAQGSVLLSAALMLDVAWARSHYDVIAAGARMRVATPWRLRPGIALGAALQF
jgi:hypothetical protein